MPTEMLGKANRDTFRTRIATVCAAFNANNLADFLQVVEPVMLIVELRYLL